jgi:hypothetical protein
MNDDKLMQAAQQLGARAAERLDVDAAARKVVERLREQPAHRGGPIWVRATWLRIAAAVVILVGGVITLREIRPGGTPDDVTHFIADDLRDLSTDELRTLLTSFDQIIGDSVVPDSTSDLQELDAQQLRELLREG